ncbi:hypothetical protein EG835_00910, partial [bacterium]|nr:hypothetical protein [bacterium]
MEPLQHADVSAVEPPERASRGQRPPRWLIALLSAAAAVLALGAIFDLGTSSPTLCASCHEMAPRSESWDRSAHRVVACVDCHQSPTEWYQYPTRLSDRVALLSRDVQAHFSGAYAADVVDG